MVRFSDTKELSNLWNVNKNSVRWIEEEIIARKIQLEAYLQSLLTEVPVQDVYESLKNEKSSK